MSESSDIVSTRSAPQGAEPCPVFRVDGEIIDFVSDLHLCPEMPRPVASFLAYLSRTQAQTVVLLGDVFEAWVGDDAIPQAFESRCVSALRQFSARGNLLIMRGNRDFLLGPVFFEATGARSLPDPCILDAPYGQALLTHGDAWCVADTAYQTFRQQVRHAAWQAGFLGKPLTDRLAIAQGLRAASKAHQQDPNLSHADVDLDLAAEQLQASNCTVLVHGHTHKPASGAFGQRLQRHVLSDWDLDHGMPGRAEVLRWSTHGWQRLQPDDC